MSRTKLISPGIPNYTLKRNLILNDKYLSNDGGDEGIRIDDDGNVLINTTANVQSSKLQVNGYIGMTDAYDLFWGASRNTSIVGSEGTNYLKLMVNGFSKMTLDNDGKVEVEDATTSSASGGGVLRLISNDGAVMADDHRLGAVEFSAPETAETTGGARDGTQVIGAKIEALADATWSASENGTDLNFYTNDGNDALTQRMTILADGKVGIGTTEPSQSLHVQYVNNKLTFGGSALVVETDNSSSPALSIKGTGSADLVNIFDNTTEVFTILDGGNVGIGIAAPTTELHVVGDGITFESTNADDPLVIIKNTTNDATGARLRFVKDKGAAGAADDVAGLIEFYADNTTQGQILFSEIKSQVAVHTANQEGGKLSLGVATHDGEMQYGLILTDGNAEDEIDVSIGVGTASLTTIAGNLTITANTTIGATKQLYLDGGGDTYIVESGTDRLEVFVGGDGLLRLSENGLSGNQVWFRTASAGFTRLEANFSSTGIIDSGGTDDTDIDFRHSNKTRLEMTGDITTINLIFPSVSANFLLVCTTDGDHDVTNWKVFESDASAATTADVMWAGGSVPAFTSSGVDIVSFYWDATEQQCYGNASLAFATP